MVVSNALKSVTIDEFEAWIRRPENIDKRFEFINGEIVQKIPTRLHAFIQALIAGTFLNYFRINTIGWSLTEVRIKLPDSDKHDLIPDVVAMLKEGRTLADDEPMPYMPELIVEIKSPNDRLSQMWEKANYYLTHGAKIVWLVHTEKRLIYVITTDADHTLDINDTLNGGDVLPGFTLPVIDLFSET